MLLALWTITCRGPGGYRQKWQHFPRTMPGCSSGTIALRRKGSPHTEKIGTGVRALRTPKELRALSRNSLSFLSTFWPLRETGPAVLWLQNNYF
jgi:hypothetical protein